MAIQAKPDRSLRLVLSGASADVTLVISDAAERPVATMVVAPAQLREIVQSFGNILRLVEGEAASGALPVNAPWQRTGFVVDAPAWRVAQEAATGLVVLSLLIAPGSWWSFTLAPEQARQLGARLGASVGGEAGQPEAADDTGLADAAVVSPAVPVPPEAIVSAPAEGSEAARPVAPGNPPGGSAA
jgi:hypothetical protein